jgi:hypothetical protein
VSDQPILKIRAPIVSQNCTIQRENEQLVCTPLWKFSITVQLLIITTSLGVLTKPDRIPSGETGNWLSFIRNEKEHLTNGWYAVKQPGSQAIEKGITWAEAREQEDRFFASESGWTDLDPIYHKYLRTSKLVARLSEILSDLISKRFFFQSFHNSDHACFFINH